MHTELATLHYNDVYLLAFEEEQIEVAINIGAI